MLRRDKKIKSETLKTVMYTSMLALVLAGCTTLYESGMTEIDKQLQEEGKILHCTEVMDSRCITHQWVNETANMTFRRF
ncbi:MAG: hypothetical protein JRJ45_00205 [Deltaproteobacteria bacterium]|nr:hypothetical protein [Deltaproteobacteria bacterium]